MDSAHQAHMKAWSLWARLARPALLRYPVLGVGVALAIVSPAGALPRSQEFVSSQPTQRQMHMLRSYERYMSRVRAQSVRAGRAVKFAYRQVGKPYQWGGAGPRTYDCSGLAMAAWRKGGLRLPHRADLQHRTIRRRVGIKHLRAGDLVFFSGDHHVGIYVGHRHFLHAPHTGARVQRGTLSGWRLRTFAGAARPGAPAFHAWPRWVRKLADHADVRHDGSRRHRRGHRAIRPGLGIPVAAPDRGADEPGISPEYRPPAPDADTSEQTPDGDIGAPAQNGAPANIGALSQNEPAASAETTAPVIHLHAPGRPVPPATDAAHAPPAVHESPAPKDATTAVHGPGTVPTVRHHWPRASVQTDSDDYNRTFNGNDDGDGDDHDRTGSLDVPELRGLLGSL